MPNLLVIRGTNDKLTQATTGQPFFRALHVQPYPTLAMMQAINLRSRPKRGRGAEEGGKQLETRPNRDGRPFLYYDWLFGD